MFQPIRDDHALSTLESIFWGIVGIFLAFFAQSAAANIEYALGIEMGSENTEQIVGLNQNRSTHHLCYIHYWTDPRRNCVSKSDIWFLI